MDSGLVGFDLKNVSKRRTPLVKGRCVCGWETGHEGGRSSQVSQAYVGLSTARHVQYTHEGQILKYPVYRSWRHV